MYCEISSFGPHMPLKLFLYVYVSGQAGQIWTACLNFDTIPVKKLWTESVILQSEDSWTPTWNKSNLLPAVRITFLLCLATVPISPQMPRGTRPNAKSTEHLRTGWAIKTLIKTKAKKLHTFNYFLLRQHWVKLALVTETQDFKESQSPSLGWGWDFPNANLSITYHLNQFWNDISRRPTACRPSFSHLSGSTEIRNRRENTQRNSHNVAMPTDNWCSLQRTHGRVQRDKHVSRRLISHFCWWMLNTVWSRAVKRYDTGGNKNEVHPKTKNRFLMCRHTSITMS